MLENLKTEKRRLAVDIGGTFTDAVLLDTRSGELFIEKVPSTSEDYSMGVMASTTKIEGGLGGVGFFTHGTTVGTNALIQGQLCKMGLITTKGFRDILELGRSNRVNMYDPLYSMPKPLVPRKYRREVNERIDREGKVIQPLDEKEVIRVVKELEGSGVEGIVVCLINAYANPIHEEKIKEIINKTTVLLVCISSEVTREYREYEKTSTAVINLGIMPVMREYLAHLKEKLIKEVPEIRLHIMQSNGGLLRIEEAEVRPVYTIQSTLSGGISGILELSRLTGEENLIGADMGGTSFDVELVSGGRAEIIPFFKIKTLSSGTDGYPVMTPTLDVHSIGAGGGSIAWLDEGGDLHVGPQSAGANPGPACYGKGGKEPTVTDANLLLGRLNPDSFLGGEMKIHPPLAKQALEKLANKIGIGTVELAHGIIEIATKNMAATIRNMLLRKGLDPREFSLVAFGGGGPMHAGYIAEELDIPQIIIVNSPGNFSAWGMLMADLRYDFVQTNIKLIGQVNLDYLTDTFRAMEEEGEKGLREGKVPREDMEFFRSLDLRYAGQERALNLPIPGGEITRKELERIEKKFDQLHERTYLHSAPDEPKEILNIRVAVTGKVRKPPLKEIETATKKAVAKEKRQVYFKGEGYIDCPIYQREELSAGDSFQEPLIIEEKTSTTVLLPGYQLEVDKYAHLIMRSFRKGSLTPSRARY